MTNNREELYEWLFHYNHHTKAWAAFKREHATAYFNGDHTFVIRSKSQRTLEELICSHGGDIQKINEIVALNI